MKSNTPKISIVVSIYKVPEKLLRNNIEHLINQTLKEIEIILVDDGSPDNCGTICDEYTKDDKRIIVIHQKNKGLSGARNTGVKKATGQYIMFLDGDDYINNNACQLMYDNSSEAKYDVINAKMTKDYENKIVEYDYSKFVAGKVYTGKECKYWQEKVLDFNANISSVNAKLIKRNILIDNNIFHNEELRQGAEGIEFLIRLFDKVDTIKFVDENIYHYIYNNESITQKHNEKNHYYVVGCFDEIERIIKECDNKDNLYKALYTRMIYVIVTTAISGFFSPRNKNEKYSIQKEKFNKFMKQQLLIDSMKKGDVSSIDKKRKTVYFFIKHKFYLIVKLFAYIRYKQKENS